MAVLRLRLPLAGASGSAADGGPRGRIEIGVEPGKNHRAVRQAGDRRDEPRRRRHGAGGAGDDHRAVRLAGETGSFRRDHPVSPRGGFDRAALGQNARPVLARDSEKLRA